VSRVEITHPVAVFWKKSEATGANDSPLALWVGQQMTFLVSRFLSISTVNFGFLTIVAVAGKCYKDCCPDFGCRCFLRMGLPQRSVN
tara:strand:- start:331 stop:591 length:261 start_codon:yes stop_codon:yes gene_type:complete